MSTHPILMSPPMVCAIMREIERPGTGKIETRRVLTRLSGRGKISDFGPSTTAGYDWHFRDSGKRWHDISTARLQELLPFAVGDRLYLREAWQAADWYDPVAPRIIPREAYVAYLADGMVNDPTDEVEIGYVQSGDWGRNRIGMHMPRWASRITLVVTEVVVERLDEITEEGAVAEGLSRVTKDGKLFKWGIPDRDGLPGKDDHGWPWDEWNCDPRLAYRTLWDSLNAKRGLGWGANPWVVVIRFKPHLCNVDHMEAV